MFQVFSRTKMNTQKDNTGRMIPFRDLPESARTHGLSSHSVREMREQYGRNELTPPRRTPLWIQFLSKFNDPIIRILLVAVFISAIVAVMEGGSLIDTIGIVMAVLLATGISFVTEYRSNREFEALNAMREDTGIKVIRDDHAATVPMRDLVVGDLVLLEAGDVVPADGYLLQASNFEVDESAFTGESEPLGKTVEEVVLKGTLVTAGRGRMIIGAVGDATQMGRIAADLAEGSRPETPLQLKLRRLAGLVSRFGYLMAGLIIATLMIEGIFTGVFTGSPAAIAHYVLDSFMFAVIIIVVSVPEGLPVSVTVSLALTMRKMTRAFSLVRRLIACETVGSVTVICTDKTGTLTRGLPVVTMHTRVDCDYPNCAACDEVLALASAVERRSTHPLAHAVVSAAGERGVLDAYPPAEGVQVLAGLGLQGEVNGSTVTVGSHRLFHDSPAHSPAACRIATRAEENGETAMLIHNGDQVCGVIAAADEIRPESAAVIGELHRLGCRTALLTGDHAAAAQRVADVLGMDDVRAGLLPAEKLAAIRRLAEQPGGAAMVGDGINDAPALAAATVGIAMGGAASAQAMDTADVVLMADGLGQLPGAVRLSRRVRAIITQNIAFTLAVKLGFVALAMAGITTLWLAVLADTGVTLVVIANGMRPVLGRGKN